jgi:toxin FitB
MFLLDTNVLSALISTAPPPAVARWVASQPAELLFTAALCQAEILAGLAMMPAGRRRRALEQATQLMFEHDFAGRVLGFDASAASAYARIVASRRRAGRPGAAMDMLIAATALANGTAVVTRNVADFVGSGVSVVNPWDE